jgi:hypothetical protein
VETIVATSPDGRSWTIDAFKEPFALGGEQGMSWGYVIGSVIVLGLAIWLAFVSWYFAAGLAILLIIWLSERVSNHMRPRFRARTEGPPAEEMTWKATSFGRRELEQRIAHEIAHGNANLEPPGLTLLSHQGH